jgi:hypothetical protein
LKAIQSLSWIIFIFAKINKKAMEKFILLQINDHRFLRHFVFAVLFAGGVFCSLKKRPPK